MATNIVKVETKANIGRMEMVDNPGSRAVGANSGKYGVWSL